MKKKSLLYLVKTSLLSTVMHPFFYHALAVENVVLESPVLSSSSSNGVDSCPKADLWGDHKLIVGRYITAGSGGGGFPSNCSCGPGAQSDCFAQCRNADYSRYLKFETIDNSKTNIWVAVIGKHAEMNALVNLLEKNAVYSFCAYAPAKPIPNAQNMTIYRLDPFYTPKKVRETAYDK